MPIKDDRIDLVLADCGASAGPDQRLLWELATRLPESRYRIAVWLFGGHGMDAFAEALAAHAASVRRLGDPWGFLGTGAVGLWLELRKQRPMLLHLNGPFGRGRRAAGVLSAATHAGRLVLSQRRLDPEAGFARGDERRLAALADAIVTPRHDVGERVVRELGVARERVRVLPDGIDPPDPEPEAAAARGMRESLGAGALRPLLLCPERVPPGGANPTLLDALARLAARGVGFVAAFTAEGAARAELERQARARDLERHVRCLGPLRDLGPALSAADVVVLPEPGDPAAPLLESLVRGRPVIAAAGPEAAEHVEDGLTGRLFQSGDVAALDDAIEGLFRNPDAARRLGAAAARQVCETHTWQGVVDALEAVYDEVLGLATFAPEDASFSHAER